MLTMESHSFKTMNYITWHNSLNKLLVPFCLSWRVLQPPDLGVKRKKFLSILQTHILVTIFVTSNCSSSVNLSRIATTFVMFLSFCYCCPLFTSSSSIVVRIGKHNYHSFKCLRRKRIEKQTYRFIVIYYFSHSNLVLSLPLIE